MSQGRYEAFGRALDRCESFIERRFVVALLFSEQFSFEPVAGQGNAIAQDSYGVVLGQQVPVGAYRVDFAMKMRTSRVRVAIELDGFKFHDATPEAAERDRVRDRVLVAQGWRVVRYAGREVVRDALGCARQAHDVTLTISKAMAAMLAKAGPPRGQLPLRTIA